MRKKLTGSSNNVPDNIPEPQVYGRGTSFADDDDGYDFEKWEKASGEMPKVIVIDPEDTSPPEDPPEKTDSLKQIGKGALRMLLACAAGVTLILWFYAAFCMDIMTKVVPSDDYDEALIRIWHLEERRLCDIDFSVGLETEEERLWVKSFAAYPEVKELQESGEPGDGDLPLYVMPGADENIFYDNLRYSVSDDRILITSHYSCYEKDWLCVMTTSYDSQHPVEQNKSTVFYDNSRYARYHIIDGRGHGVVATRFVFHHYGVVGLIKDTVEYYIR